MSPKLAHFSPPGGLTDLSDGARQEWSAVVSAMIDGAIEGNPEKREHDSPRPQCFNPTATELADDAKELGIFWFAFPRTLQVMAGSDLERWRAADAKREKQDEYCEWAVHRGDDDKITSVVFTTETPEYWQQIARDKETLRALYKELLGEEVPVEDLFDEKGAYILDNVWNNRTDLGPIHLMQGTNFLSAAVELAAAATIVRKIDGQVITAEQELIACSKFGERRRNSDPHIGAQVNELARAKADVTLADPAGLCIASLNTGGWKTPDDADPQEFWQPVRGEKGQRVRMKFEVPGDKQYVVGDITINGRNIGFGAQIADFVSVRLTGLAHRFGASTVEPQTACRVDL